MPPECHPITVLPNLSRIFRDYTELRSTAPDAPIRNYYTGTPFDDAWQQGTTPSLQADRSALTASLEQQNRAWGAGEATLRNLDALSNGARAVVTGQQVGLFGGPLLTLMKAATAIRKAKDATAAGIPHVPIFWMATEDHDLDEVNQATLLGKDSVITLRSSFPQHRQQPVGALVLGAAIDPVLAEAEELLKYAPITEVLRAAYTPADTLASAFAKFLTAVFGDHGLIIIDPSTRAYHQLGAAVLRYAIEHADELNTALLARTAQLEGDGYHAQVLVHSDSSLLFLIDDAGDRLALKRKENQWHAGNRTYTTAELLDILAAAPERISPNALLRPVFQDSILPTSAYVGGPAEIAYFAQSQPLFEAILFEGQSSKVTPALPRLSATLVPPAVRAVMDQHEIEFLSALTTADDLAQRLGARSMPIEGKRTIAAAGNALDTELKAVEHWMGSMSESLGHSATVAAGKMRYQMNRLRRLAANWQLERDTFLAKHAGAITRTLFPRKTPQERLLNGVVFLALAQSDLATLLVDNASQECPGHRVFDI